MELTQGLVGVLEVFHKDVPAGTAQAFGQKIARLRQQVSGSEDSKRIRVTNLDFLKSYKVVCTNVEFLL